MRRILVGIFVLVAVMLFPVYAFAQDATTSTSVPVAQRIISYVMNIAAALLMLLAAWGTHKVSNWVKQKTGIESDAMLSEWAAMGVSYADEQAHKYLAAHGEKLRSSEKLEAAVSFALTLAEENNLPQIGRDKLIAYIESQLGVSR